VSRKVGGRRPRSAILIVCEGAKTEPQYFKGFRLPSVEVVGAGKNTLSLVEHAFRISEGYDQTWCVFDRDSFPAQTFNAAIQRAATHGFKVAYSNEAFEIWYLLHFDFHASALSRTLYEQKLTERLGRPYKKNDPAMFDALRGRQDQAIGHARRLLADYAPNHNPEQDNPCTTVHLLVEQLRALTIAGA
jgi:RloB-like protein